jgi:hypothetical protein
MALKEDELLAILAAIVLPSVHAERTRLNPKADMLESIEESVKYAGDIRVEVESFLEAPDEEDDGVIDAEFEEVKRGARRRRKDIE